ncbi:MAG TPA: hypothetical protein VHL09_09500, partial [Dehalococcoidia bacterium]|nr:hypothetical protein [Dehalococcoidia bacterium]
MSSALRRSTVVSCLLALVTLLGTAGQTGAQESEMLRPLVEEGQLTVAGSGFQSGEDVMLRLVIDRGSPREFSVVADGQGQFHLATGEAIDSGAQMELVARGDR